MRQAARVHGGCRIAATHARHAGGALPIVQLLAALVGAFVGILITDGMHATTHGTKEVIGGAIAARLLWLCICCALWMLQIECAFAHLLRVACLRIVEAIRSAINV